MPLTPLTSIYFTGDFFVWIGQILLSCSDGDGVFTADLGNVLKSSARYSRMRIYRRTLSVLKTW